MTPYIRPIDFTSSVQANGQHFITFYNVYLIISKRKCSGKQDIKFAVQPLNCKQGGCSYEAGLMHHSFSPSGLKAFLVLYILERPFTHLINILVGSCPCSCFRCVRAVSLLLHLPIRSVVILLFRVKSSEQQLVLLLKPFSKHSLF